MGHDRVVAQLGRRGRHDLVERPLVLVPQGLAGALGDAVDGLRSPSFWPGVASIRPMRGEQQVVHLVHGVGDRGVRADEGTVHAAGADVGVELGTSRRNRPLSLAAPVPGGMNSPTPGSTGASAMVPSRKGRIIRSS